MKLNTNTLLILILLIICVDGHQSALIPLCTTGCKKIKMTLCLQFIAVLAKNKFQMSDIQHVFIKFMFL
jgi:hypothetical protein